MGGHRVLADDGASNASLRSATSGTPTDHVHTSANAETPLQFVDLAETHRPLHAEIIAAWSTLLDTAGFIGGRHLDEFEAAFADYVGTRHAIGVANGTDALELILRALEIGPGDEVVTVAHTFVATAEAIVSVGATPVLVDVDELTGTMNPAALEQAITARTRAVLPVHLYGQTADMRPIVAIADAHGIPVIEDACQAHGAGYEGRRAGSLGTAAAFSFYPGKNLGAAGDAGAITTNDDDLADRLRVRRDHGQAGKSVHVVSGVNSRLDAVQAAVLGIKLPHLDEWNEQRRHSAKEYGANLDGSLVQLPEEADGRFHVYHLFVVRHAERDRFREVLQQRGIPTGMHYPTPVHLHPAFQHLGRGEGSFPHAERWAAQGISLPMHPHLATSHIERVVTAVNQGLS